MGLDTAASLILATMDLSVVRMLRGAMRAADAQGSPGINGCSTAACNTFPGCHPVIERRFHLHPTPRIEPRDVFHPTPRILPRVVYHPERIAPKPPAPPIEIIVECEPAKCPSMTPLQPPWKVLPWENPPQPAPKVKIVVRKTDLIRKGSLIDFFI